MAIYANLMGRLGNQMFIYAFARALQEKSADSQRILLTGSEENRLFNYKVSYAECDGEEARSGKTLFQYALSVFYGKYGVKGKSQAELFTFEKKHLGLFSGHNLFYCRNGYLPFKGGKEKNTYIIGFFQSVRYFQNIREILLWEFTPKDVSGIPSDTACLLRNDPLAVCVSIRLGDYVNNPVHGVCTTDYYVRAMKMMKEKLGNPLFYISTESPEIIKAMDEFKGFDMIFEDSRLRDFEKMYLTNQCTNFILSNSSFSWWGYYLSSNREKNSGITIAPDRWFNTDIPCDIYMDDWILIKP